MVEKAGADMVCVVLGLSEECGDVVVIEVVLDLVAAAPDWPYQSAIPQETELMGYGGLASTDGQCEVAHAERPPHQRVQNLRSGGIAEGIEGLHHQPEDFLLGQPETCLGDGLRVEWQVSELRDHPTTVSAYLCRYS